MMMAPQRPKSWFQGCVPIGLMLGVLFVGSFCVLMVYAETSSVDPLIPGLLFIGLILATVAAATIIGVLRYQRYRHAVTAELVARQEAERAEFMARQQQRIHQEEQERQRAEQARLQALEDERKERERIANLKALGNLLTLTPREFEDVIRSMLVGLGVLQEATVVGGAGDRGADIIGTTRDGDTFIVQCKRYAPGSRIGTPDIQRFIGAIHIHQADRGVFVTTCSFSDPAIELAKEHNILLADGEDCIELLQRLSSQGQ